MEEKTDSTKGMLEMLKTADAVDYSKEITLEDITQICKDFKKRKPQTWWDVMPPGARTVIYEELKKQIQNMEHIEQELNKHHLSPNDSFVQVENLELDITNNEQNEPVQQSPSQGDRIEYQKSLISAFYNLVQQTGSHRAARRKLSRKTGIPVEDLKVVLR